MAEPFILSNALPYSAGAIGYRGQHPLSGRAMQCTVKAVEIRHSAIEWQQM